MAHVLALLPDVIKLDMSLTRGIDQDRNRRALASAMISFASDLGATIIAEGIETRGELDTLRALGARYGQGFYLSPPGGPFGVRTWPRSWARSRSLALDPPVPPVGDEG